MKPTGIAYILLGLVGMAAAVLIPLIIHQFGTSALPAWQAVVSPGPISAAHAFLGNQCEACHTPTRGILAGSCIGCHIAAPRDLAKPSTIFHATIQDCRGCHIEHQGPGVRPTAMDHAALARIGWRRTANMSPRAAEPSVAIRLVQSVDARWTEPSAAKAEAELDCAACHSFRDKHQRLFGQRCEDCHGTAAWKVNSFLHPSPQSRDCNQCHQAPPSHFMMHFAMMDQGMTGQHEATVEQCYLCHQTDSFNDIKGLGWFKMH